MFSWLKKHFIPHIGNNFRPHLLHGENARLIVLGLILVEAFTFFALTTSFRGGSSMAAVITAVLGDLTNKEREALALNDLTPNPLLNESATLKAEDMAEKGYFAHTSPEGKTPWYWLEKVGYDYEYAGENLAVHFNDSVDVENAWMNSPSHRANIEKAQYTEIGTGIATGTLDGVETIFVAQVYAKPAPKNAAATAAVTKVASTSAPAVSQNTAATPEQSIGSEKVLGASVGAVSVPDKSTFAQKAIASPRHTTNAILFVAAGIIILALALALIFWTMRGKLPHYDLMTNGLLVLAIIGAIYLANVWLSNQGPGLETSFTSFAASTTAVSK